MNKILIILTILTSYVFSNDFFYIKDNQKIHLEKIQDISRASSSVDYYKDENNVVLGVNKNIILSLKEGTLIEKYLKLYDLEIEKKLDSNLFLVKTTNKSKTLEVSNELNRKNDVIFAQPDFVKEVFAR